MISLPQPDFVHSFHVGMTGRLRIHSIDWNKEEEFSGNKFIEKTNVETIEQKFVRNLPLIFLDDLLLSLRMTITHRHY